MNTVIVLIAAALIGLLVQRFLSGFDYSVHTNSASDRVGKFATADRRGVSARLGDSIVDRFGLTLESWQHELRWAQLGGFHEGGTVGSVLGKSILFGLGGLLYLILFNAWSPFFLIMIGVAAYYPYMQLKGRGDDVRQAVKRSLPEAAALIAAEMSAGGSAEVAVTRAASLPGPLGNLLRGTASKAQGSGRLMFSRATVEGALIEDACSYRSQELEAFASLVDLVAARGADAPKQMGEVARGLAREYRSEVEKSAGQLSNKLLAPISLFIFLPFMLAVFAPLAFGIFEAF
jgi:tight adherence protein C